MTVCAYCLQTSAQLHREHVVPLSRGGPDSPYNIVMACESCNLRKGTMLPSEWRTDLPVDIYDIESRMVAHVKNTDRRARRRRESADKSFVLSCLCGDKIVGGGSHGTGYDDRYGYDLDEALRSGTVAWYRECDRGRVVELLVGIGQCNEPQRLHDWDRMHLGRFECRLGDPAPLLHALKVLRWERAARRSSQVVLSALVGIDRALLDPPAAKLLSAINEVAA